MGLGRGMKVRKLNSWGGVVLWKKKKEKEKRIIIKFITLNLKVGG